MTAWSDGDFSQDPGWQPSLRAVGWFLVPGVGLAMWQRRARTERMDGLVMLRTIFLTFSGALVMIGGVVAVLTNVGSFGSGRPTGLSPTVAAIAVAGVGALTLIVGSVRSRPLVSTGPAEAAGSYRTRFFLAVAFADSAALVGFVGFVIVHRWWLYVLGVVFAAFGFARLAPTAAHLARDQDALYAAGSTVNVVAALRRAMPPPPTRTSRLR